MTIREGSGSPAAEVWEWGELLDSPYQAPPWVIDQLLPERGTVLIAAKEGTGKSIFGMQAALCVAGGHDLLGLTVPRPRPVLYIQSEGDMGDTAQRGHDMGLVIPHPAAGMLTWAYLLRRKINTKPGRDGLRELAERAGLDNGVLFIDPAYPTIRGSMKDDEPVAEWTDNVNVVCQEFHSAAVVFQHEHRDIRDAMGKTVKEGLGDKTFGSFVWKAWASYGFELRPTANKGPLMFQAWKQRRPTALSEEPLLLTMVEPTPLLFVRAEEGVTSSMATVRELLRCVQEPLTKDGIVERLSRDKKHARRRTAIQDAVAALEGKGDIETVGGSWPRAYQIRGQR